jgi:hypothetical protein
VPEHDWEKIKREGDEAVKKWIKEQMKNRSCTVVFAGNQTANRKWINHEIVESWNAGMGVVGIHIYGLKNEGGYVSQKGENPFHYILQGPAGGKLSEIVACYDPPGANSKERLDWIAKFIPDAFDEAIKIRESHQGIFLRSL